MSVNLPSGWDSYSASDKIDYFNDAGITSQDLMAAGVPASDISWMISNGYTGGASTPSYTTSGATTSSLPSGWSNYSPQQKIEYFNKNYITPAQLISEGVPQSDIDWMYQNGYTGGGRKQPTYNTRGPLTSLLPANWSSFSPEQKIKYFNDNKITPGQLLAEGVPQSDIDWMLGNGYTGGSDVKPIEPTPPSGGGGGLSGTTGNLTGTGQNLNYSQTQYNPNGGAQNQTPTATYQSNLIQSLRSRNTGATPNNPGFTLYQTAPVGQSNTFQPPSSSGNAFNPQPIQTPDYDPASIFKDVYGRDPTSEELNQTSGMSPNDLRATLEKSFAEWEAAQKGQQGQQDLPFDPFAFTQNAIKENTGIA